MADGAGDGRFDRLADRVGDADEAQVTGEGGDDLLAVVARALAHHRAEHLQQLVRARSRPCGGPGADEGGAVGLDDAAADRGAEVAAEGLLDPGAETLVAEDEGDVLQESRRVPASPGPGRPGGTPP